MLVDLIGYSNFEFIGKLIGGRHTIVENVISSSKKAMVPISKTQSDPSYKKKVPVYGTQVTVMTQEEKDRNYFRLLKNKRKIEKIGRKPKSFRTMNRTLQNRRLS